MSMSFFLTDLFLGTRNSISLRTQGNLQANFWGLSAPWTPDFNFSASKLKEHKETVIAKAGAKAPRFCWLWLCQRVSCSWQMSDNWYQSAFSRPTVVTKKVLIYQRFKFQHDRRLTQTVRCLTVIAKCLTKIDRCLTYTF